MTPEDRLEPLTPREAQILQCFANGVSRASAPGALGMAPKTLRRHLSNIYAKFRVNNATGAVVRAAQAGLVALEPVGEDGAP